MKAYLYDTRKENAVRCQLCSHRCVIKDGRRGLCAVRENRDGTLHTLVYGKVIAGHVDPIEKKPLYHFLPGSQSYSIATVGCNFSCSFCQNADIAQMPADRDGMIMGNEISPAEVVDDARQAGCTSISYTYTEPTVFFEFAYDTARLAHDYGLKNIFVTNGYMSGEAVKMVSPFLDAANVDLKAFSDRFYRERCGARLQPVLDTLKRMVSQGVFVEVTTLIVPGLNDSPDELKQLAGFIAEQLDPATPWHISRFHPTYRLTDRGPTPVKTLETARDIGLAAGLQFVYTGNVPGDAGGNTYCPGCGEMIMERWGFRLGSVRVKNGACSLCGEAIAGVWD
jgi:pyruvate formate lyase activating enzyme